MSNTCVILVLFFAFVSCTFSSYLDIPPPPERPMRFKTKEQIETYLKAVKDYYDAFKIKLVRRENSISNRYPHLDKSINGDDDNNNNNEQEELKEELYLLQKLFNINRSNEPTRNYYRRRQQDQARQENNVI